MKKIISIIIGTFVLIVLCSCANTFADEAISDEYTTIELDVSLLMSENYLTIAEEKYDEDGNYNPDTEVGYVGSSYLVLFNDQYFKGSMFFAHGDKVKLTYKKDVIVEGSNFINEYNMTEIKRIKNANISVVSSELIERDKNGVITHINVEYETDEVIITNDKYNYSYYKDFTGETIYMSVAKNVLGKNHCVFYSFNPEEV